MLSSIFWASKRTIKLLNLSCFVFMCSGKFRWSIDFRSAKSSGIARSRGQGVHCISLIPTSIVKFEWCLRRELFSIRAETTIPMLHESNVWCLFALSKKDTNVTPAATQHMWEKCRGSNLFCKNVHNNPKIKEDSKKIMQPHRAPFLYQQKPKTTE